MRFTGSRWSRIGVAGVVAGAVLAGGVAASAANGQGGDSAEHEQQVREDATKAQREAPTSTQRGMSKIQIVSEDEVFDINRAVRELQCESDFANKITTQVNPDGTSKETPAEISERFGRSRETIPLRDSDAVPDRRFIYNAAPEAANMVRVEFRRDDGSLTSILIADDRGNGWFLRDFASCSPPRPQELLDNDDDSKHPFPG